MTVDPHELFLETLSTKGSSPHDDITLCDFVHFVIVNTALSYILRLSLRNFIFSLVRWMTIASTRRNESIQKVI